MIFVLTIINKCKEHFKNENHWSLLITRYPLLITRNTNTRSTQLSGQQHANIISLFQFNSRIVVENCVVGICNNRMFLEFHEFETKYLAGVYT